MITDHEILLLLPDWSEPEKEDLDNQKFHHPNCYAGQEGLEFYKSEYLVDPKSKELVNNPYLPPVTTSIDAWYKWVWPVLIERGFWEITIQEIDETDFRISLLESNDGFVKSGKGKILMEALNKATKEALK